MSNIVEGFPDGPALVVHTDIDDELDLAIAIVLVRYVEVNGANLCA